MRIDVPRLDAAGERFCGRLQPGVLGLDPEQALVRETEGIAYDVFAAIVSGALLVRGGLWIALDAECARCGRRFLLTVRDDDFCEHRPLEDDRMEVNLTPAMREAILLALPAHPVCDPPCQGLGPPGGRRRDESAPACDGGAGGDVRWRALEALPDAGPDRAGDARG